MKPVKRLVQMPENKTTEVKAYLRTIHGVPCMLHKSIAESKQHKYTISHELIGYSMYRSLTKDREALWNEFTDVFSKGSPPLYERAKLIAAKYSTINFPETGQTEITIKQNNMSIQLTVTGETLADVKKQLQVILGDDSSNSSQAAPVKTRRGRPPATAATEEHAQDSTPEPAPVPSTTTTAEPAQTPVETKQTTEAVTLDELRALGKKAMDANKIADVKKIVRALGADRITSLDPSKYEEAKEKIEAALSTDDGEDIV